MEKTARTTEHHAIADPTAATLVLEGLTGYINAGGRGVRLSQIFPPHGTKGVSKALLPIGEPPIPLVEHQINRLIYAGISSIVAGVGDHDTVAAYVRSRYRHQPGVHAVYYNDQLGTGGDLVRAVRDRPNLFGSRVFISCVDTLLDIDEVDFATFHDKRGRQLSIALTENRGVPNQDAYYVGEGDQVLYSAEAISNPCTEETAARKAIYRGSSTGAMIAETALLRELPWQPGDGPLPLDKAIVASVLAQGEMAAYNNGTRLFTDIGTVPAWNDMQARRDMIAPYIRYAT